MSNVDHSGTHSMKAMAGQSVIGLDTAEEIGKVKHFVVATDLHTIERLHVDGRRKKAVFVDWEDLESFGTDRVMVTSAGAVHESDSARDIDAAKGDVVPLGSRILDDAGYDLGTVADVIFDSATGDLVSVLASDGTEFPRDALHSLGSFALVVAAS